MKKRLLVIIASSTFAVFGILLSIGILVSTNDRISDLESRVNDRISDLESSVNNVEWKLVSTNDRISDLESRVNDVEWKLRR
ncbi:MAG: hypothetical protein JRG74_07515 [Deltaproteobacteria bacterium]|nr:hypothetical protein [Deltaproteobacteria bacterium]MBW2742103.1 hypothetical protein [Deltaproteobacteria bacterium]